LKERGAAPLSLARRRLVNILVNFSLDFARVRQFETLYITLMQFTSLCTTLRQFRALWGIAAVTLPPAPAHYYFYYYYYFFSLGRSAAAVIHKYIHKMASSLTPLVPLP